MNLLHEMSVAYGYKLATELKAKAQEREQAEVEPEKSETAPQPVEKKSELEGTHKLSEEEKEKLSGREAKEKNEDKYGDLPAHIRRMLERLEEMKEELDVLRQEVAQLNAKIDHNNETEKALFDQKNQYFIQLQNQYFDMIKNVKEAMKEAGVTDMSVLLKAIA
ncbi:hypothetical protein N474_15725 [Pseudoalteromonas luteoviolacea CPMOR-2]|uniref:Uncharacterized protein n=2 Tax=Pseudoalteromonas luteoviolacea TaxID=43657 RepID=A0A166YMC6_9GAMM|nr:hypothetical protein N475_00115 [Pseudoalteromonas luteoviolacea DSM 6061]KZN55426.1 hypothetical protein N474_15725 [Pseudoalteromonas luteoviolacea CPMOR-2]MBE0385522.1 hypothetical protein [Pseudoalteromonas luteoviolacea DSM 6061]